MVHVGKNKIRENPHALPFKPTVAPTVPRVPSTPYSRLILYPAGVILFELLTGRLPFAGVDRNKIRENILEVNYIVPAHVSQGAAELVKAILVGVFVIQEHF